VTDAESAKLVPARSASRLFPPRCVENPFIFGLSCYPNLSLRTGILAHDTRTLSTCVPLPFRLYDDLRKGLTPWMDVLAQERSRGAQGVFFPHLWSFFPPFPPFSGG